MRICFYTYTFLPTVGGAEFLLHGLASSLVERGHEATVWAPYVRGRDNRLDTKYRIRRYPRPSSKRFGVRQTVPFLLWEKFRRGMDVLHCHGAYPAAYVGASLKKITGVPMVVRPHGADILPGEWIRQSQHLERRMIGALRTADRIVAQGQSLKDELTALGIPAERIETIHNGVRRPPAAPRRPNQPPYLLSMGSLSPKKGYDVLLRAFQTVASDIPSLRLIVAGDGARRQELLDETSRCALTERVRWAGEVDETAKQDLLTGATAYVCPSRREPFSNALLEAMAHGLPIVATAVGGNTEMLEDGKSGILVPPEDDRALTGAILKIVRDEALRTRLGEEAYRRAEQFDWDGMVDRYEMLYEMIARNK